MKILSNIIKIPYKFFFTKESIFSIVYKSKIHKKAAVCMGSRIYECCIDKYSFIGKNTFVFRTSIGAFTSISNNCYIGSLSHPINWVSTSPVFHVGKNVLKKNFAKHLFVSSKQTTIGNDVWIGEGCKIKAGVTIGDGAIVGMGSIVTKNIEPFSIYAGNPAKKIKNRFEDDVTKKMNRSEWWMWSDDKITQCSDLFNDCEMFLKKIGVEEK